ncbi:MAG: hypothetical protein HOH43_02415 [Candidatus Latescibacteria bacterium]|nr:hypothetical protein [Candidatus Latescibacterota bacterium]
MRPSIQPERSGHTMTSYERSMAETMTKGGCLVNAVIDHPQEWSFLIGISMTDTQRM